MEEAFDAAAMMAPATLPASLEAFAYATPAVLTKGEPAPSLVLTAEIYAKQMNQATLKDLLSRL